MQRGPSTNDMMRAEKARVAYVRKVVQEQARREKAIISARQKAMAQQQRLALKAQKQQLQATRNAVRQANTAAVKQQSACMRAQQQMTKASLGMSTTRRRKYY